MPESSLYFKTERRKSAVKFCSFAGMNILLRPIIVAVALLIGNSSLWAATTILPPAKTCFTDATGAVAAGTVNLFYPNTTTVKPSWQDSLQTILNSAPVVLDGNGCALIFGTGAYREQLFDFNGALLFDAVTTDTSAYYSVFWAALAGGTANVITLVDPGFNAVDGTVINFTALATNTGSTTINPGGFGPINVVKSTTAGPVSLVGGEIVQSNQISVVYSSSSNTFTILNPPIVSASGNIAPLCGASGLVIVNGSSPSSIIYVTANAGVMVSSGGLVQSRTAISLAAINITTGTSTSTANGMDGEAPGISGWLYIWLIDNGSATAGLVSLASGNGLSPTLPSGYTYKCRLGAMKVDGSGNLMRTTQKGQDAQYTVVSASNTTAFPTLAAGGSPAQGLVTVSGVTIPLTASSILMIGQGANVTASSWALSSNATASSPYLMQGTGTSVGSSFLTISGTIILETTQILQSTQTNSSVFVQGWKDSVNAN